jgi:hypothetical protein
MKSVLTCVFLSVTILSCDSTKKVSGNSSHSAAERFSYINIQADTVSYICDSTFYQKLFLKLDTILTENNNYSVGQLGKCHPDNKGGFKIGKWTEYYQSGNIKSQGNYGFGIIRNCCAAGYCYGQYSYKIGRWAYYSEDKKLKADIAFDIILLPTVSMGCGDTVYYKTSSISTHSKYFDKENNEIRADSSLLNSYLKENQGWVEE